MVKYFLLFCFYLSLTNGPHINNILVEARGESSTTITLLTFLIVMFRLPGWIDEWLVGSLAGRWSIKVNPRQVKINPFSNNGWLVRWVRWLLVGRSLKRLLCNACQGQQQLLLCSKINCFVTFSRKQQDFVINQFGKFDTSNYWIALAFDGRWLGLALVR